MKLYLLRPSIAVCRALIWLALAALLPLLAWPGVAAAPLPAAEPPLSRLLFVTNRQRSDSDTPARPFGGELAPLSYGECAVEAPDEEDEGRAAGFLDFFLPLRSPEIKAVEEFGVDGFWRRLDEQVSAHPPGRLVLFVHGYSYSFARGCRRVSRLQERLGEGARVILFSWPSDGNPLAYRSDGEDLARSVAQLADLLRALRERYGGERISLLAHSMGARGAVAALGKIHADPPPGLWLDNLVLLAPDYDRADFSADFAPLRERIGRVSAYVSSKDSLLGLSSLLNGGERLGQGAAPEDLVPGVEIIDVSQLRRFHPTGHEYFRYHPVVGADLAELLLQSRGAAQRGTTIPESTAAGVYWLLRRD